jgi:deoxyadenosine/deoxycytidine kinase
MNTLSPKEIVILHALVEVKTKRGMSREVAFEEAKSQRYKEEMSLEYLDDLYQAAKICYDKFEWFRKGCEDTLKDLQGS